MEDESLTLSYYVNYKYETWSSLFISLLFAMWIGSNQLYSGYCFLTQSSGVYWKSMAFLKPFCSGDTWSGNSKGDVLKVNSSSDLLSWILELLSLITGYIFFEMNFIPKVLTSFWIFNQCILIIQLHSIGLNVLLNQLLSSRIFPANTTSPISKLISAAWRFWSIYCLFFAFCSKPNWSILFCCFAVSLNCGMAFYLLFAVVIHDTITKIYLVYLCFSHYFLRRYID